LKNYAILKLEGYTFKYQPLYSLIMLCVYGVLKNNDQIKIIIDNKLIMLIESEDLSYIEEIIFFQIIDDLCKTYVPIFYHDPEFPEEKFPIFSTSVTSGGKPTEVQYVNNKVRFKIITRNMLIDEYIDFDMIKIRFNVNATDTKKDSLLVINFFKGIDMEKDFGSQGVKL
jgi:hypothetical protein|tara:strand:- start:1389 stop:1898 length:510 start_codon:yes stop_codon:yes gene_type:complete